MIAVCTDNMDEEHPNRVPDYVEEEDDVVRKKSTRRKKHRNKGLYKDCRIYEIWIISIQLQKCLAKRYETLEYL